MRNLGLISHKERSAIVLLRENSCLPAKGAEILTPSAKTYLFKQWVQSR